MDGTNWGYSEDPVQFLTFHGKFQYTASTFFKWFSITKKLEGKYKKNHSFQDNVNSWVTSAY